MTVASTLSSRRRRTPRQDRAQQTAAAIRQAAAQVLAAEGYDRTSTNRIAEVAGVSIGTLYQYFQDKQAVLDALAEEFLRGVVDAVSTELLASGSRSLAVRLERIIISAFRALARYPGVLRQLTAAPRSNVRAQLDQAKQRIRSLIVNLLEKEGRTLTWEEVGVAVRLLVDAGEGVAFNIAASDDAELLGREFCRLALRYLGVRWRRAPRAASRPSTTSATGKPRRAA